MQFRETHAWIPALGITYALGVDGISALFVFLTALLGWICVLASWVAIDRKVKEFMVSLLVMQTLMLGVFAALDLFLFYVFWEAMLIPMYLIIGVWGGDGRVYAAFKFFLYTLAGSVVFLVGVIVLYFQGGETFDILALMAHDYPFAVESWLFFAFLIAFAVKVPMVPVHTWLPDAHVQAPTAGSIILAGVLLKMGAYGFLRFSLPMLPEASVHYATLMLALSVVAIVYGGLLALAQDDLKKLVAYSSISHMGFVTLGIFALNGQGVEGAILQMFNHGITTGALFLFVGLIYERTHTRSIADYGGLMKAAPVYTVFLALFTLSSMALPGTNSFVGELLVLTGTFGANLALGGAAVLGALLGAAYLLGMYRRVALGPARVGAAVRHLGRRPPRAGGDPAAGRVRALGRALSQAVPRHHPRLGGAPAATGPRAGGRGPVTPDALLQSILASLPEIIVVTGACVLLIAGLFVPEGRGHLLVAASLAVVAAAAAATLALAGEVRPGYSGMFVVDGFASFFKLLFYLATALTLLLSRRYAEIERIEKGEYYVLLLFALAGMMIMASATDLLSIYVGLELMALATYVLTGFVRQERRSNEAALKYVILGGVSTGIFLYGVSLIYGLTGTTQLDALAASLAGAAPRDPAFLLAVVFVVTGLVFKIGAVPFHMWVPDVYEGAPTTITAFMSVGPKAAGFAVVLRVFLNPLVAASDVWITVAVIAVITMALGSFVALVQDNIKRLLAYSSIAHAGFALLGVVAGGADGIASVMLYLLIYTFMNIGIFGAVVMMRNGDFSGEAIEDYAGFARSHRGLALMMLLFLFALAGIPPTAGFFAKFYVLVALVEQGFVTLAVIAVLLSAVAAYFYIRIVMVMYMREPAGDFDPALTVPVRIALAVAAARHHRHRPVPRLVPRPRARVRVRGLMIRICNYPSQRLG